jgi:hypothetical protein
MHGRPSLGVDGPRFTGKVLPCQRIKLLVICSFQFV